MNRFYAKIGSMAARKYIMVTLNDTATPKRIVFDFDGNPKDLEKNWRDALTAFSEDYRTHGKYMTRRQIVAYFETYGFHPIEH